MNDYEDRARALRSLLDSTDRPDIRTSLIMKAFRVEWEIAAEVADNCATTCAMMAVKGGPEAEKWEAKLDEASFVAEEIRDAIKHGCNPEKARIAALEALSKTKKTDNE